MIKLPAYLVNFRTKVDRTAGISIATNEITDQEFLLLKKHQGDFGWFIFVPNEAQIEIPTKDAEEFDKSKSKTTRSVLFLLWKQEVKEKGIDTPFKVFYDQKMDALNDMLKAKLN